jgi:hypothetical protein
VKYVVTTVWSNCIELLPVELEGRYFYWVYRKNRNTKEWDEINRQKVVVRPNVFHAARIKDHVKLSMLAKRKGRRT